MGPDGFGFFKVIQRLLKKRRHGVRRASKGELGLRLPLVKNAAVIETLVFVSQTLEGTLCFTITIGGTAVELIGDRKPEHTKCRLIIRISSQDFAANRLSLAGLV